METNYTLKKLIGGGTLLLFFLAFMLSGSITAFAQEGDPAKSTQTLNVVFVEEGVTGNKVRLKEADGTTLIRQFHESSSITDSGFGGSDLFVKAVPSIGAYVKSIQVATGGDAGTTSYYTEGDQDKLFAMPHGTNTITVTFSKKKVTVSVSLANEEYDGTDFRAGVTLAGNITFAFEPAGTHSPTAGSITYAVGAAPGIVSNSYVEFNNINFGDIANATYVFNSRHVGVKTAVYDYPTNPVLLDNANYDLVVNVENAGSFTPLAAGLSVVEAADKVYNGSDLVSDLVGNRTLTFDIVAGTGDDVSVGWVTATFETPNVVGLQTVTFEGLYMYGTHTPNYTFLLAGGIATATAEITPLTLTFSNPVVDAPAFSTGTVTTTLTSYTLATIQSQNGVTDDVFIHTDTHVVEYVDNNPGTRSVTFQPAAELAGIHSPNYTVTIAEFLVDKAIPVPVYAAFGPSILDDGAGTKTLTYNVDVATDLTISFNKHPYTGAGGDLMTQPLADLATFFRIGWRTGTDATDENTAFGDFDAIEYMVKDRAVVDGMYQFTIVPMDGDGNETTLAADSYFRLEYLGIHYKDGAIYPAVPYRLDMTPDDDVWGYFENVGAAYVDNAKHTTFKTAGLPKFKPYEVLADICDPDVEVSVSFVNPIKYRVATGSNPFIPEIDLSHRFVLLAQTATATMGEWTRIPISDYTATPSGWQDADGNQGSAGTGFGPTKITFDFDMEYNTYYVIGLLRNANETYGFIDMVTDEVVMDQAGTSTLNAYASGEPATPFALKFEHQDAPGGDDWWWKTDPLQVDILVQAVEQDVDYAKPGGPAFDFNIVDLAGLGVTHVPGWVSNTVTMAGTNSPSITLTAVPTEGQKFVQWNIYEWSEDDEYVGTATPSTVTLTLNLTPDNCGTLTVTYKATFAKNEYLFALDLDTNKGSEAAGTAYSDALSHGDEVVAAIMPKPGFEVTGWDTNWPAGVASVTYPLPIEFVLYDVPATYSATLIGPNLVDDGETVYVVTPTFAVFNPRLFAQTFYDGAFGVASLTVTHDADQEIIAERARGPFIDATLHNRWGFKTGSEVTLTAHPIVGMCEVDFVEWLRYDFIADEWVSHSDERSITFTMHNSLRFRALYDLRDLMVVVDMPDTDGQVRISDDTGVIWSSVVDTEPGIEIEIGTTVTITVLPEENLYTYGWDDENGPIADHMGIDIQDPLTAADYFFNGVNRYVIGDQRYSEWVFEVDGCEDITLYPVIDKKRHLVEVKVMDYSDHHLGAPVGYVGGTLAIEAGSAYESSHYIDRFKGFLLEKDGLVYDVRTGGATETFNTGVATETYARGYVLHEEGIHITATADDLYEFIGWYWDLGLGVVSSTSLADIEVVEGMNIEARFKVKTFDNKLFGIAEPEEGGGLRYEQPFTGIWWPLTDEGADISIPQTMTQTITVKAIPETGYQFDHMADNWDVVGVDTFTLLGGNQISFVMPDSGNVTLTATFDPAVQDVIVHIVGYQFGPSGTVADREWENPIYVGQASATIDGVAVATATFEHDIQLHAEVFTGFRFVNWMRATVPPAEPNLVGMQIAGEPNPADAYSIPQLGAGTDIHLVAVFARAEYPVYDLVVENDGRIEAKTTGKYPHGVEAEVEAYDPMPGYEFWRWSTEGSVAGDGVHGVNIHNVLMDQHWTLTAETQAVDYLLIVEAMLWVDDDTPPIGSQGGQIQIGTRTPSVLDGIWFTVVDDPTALTATPAQTADGFEYEFAGWYSNAALTEEVIVGGEHHTDAVWIWNPALSPEDTWLYAKFVRSPQTYEVELLTALGTRTTMTLEDIDVLALSGAGDYEYEDGIVVAAPAGADSEDLGYEFVRWATPGGTTITEGAAGRWFNHTVRADTTFVAVYKKIPYTVTVEADPAAGGKVVLDGVEGTVVTGTRYVGDVISVNAIAEDGWKFVKWVVGADEVETAANDITLAPGDLHLIAVFEEEFWTVTVAVVDEDDEPLAGATVTLGAMTEVTDADGEAIFEDVTDALYTLEVEATGYNAWEGSVRVDGEDKEVDVAFLQEAAPVFATAVTAKSVGVHFDEGTWRLYVDGAEFADNIADEIFVVMTDPEEEHVIGVRVWTDEAGYKIWSAVEPVTVTTLELGDVNAADGVTPADLGLLIAYMTTPAADFDYEVIADAGELFDADDDVFIWDAADINDDGDINVLDVVGLVNILNPAGDKSNVRSNAADMSMGNGLIRLDSDGTLAGVQFELIGSNLADAVLEALLPGMQIVWRVDGNVLTAVVYSPDNQAIPSGALDFIRISGASNLVWGNAFGANLNAVWVDVNTTLITTGIQDLAGALSVNVFPNPSDGQFTSRIQVEGSAQVTLRLYDLSGRVINQKQLVVHGSELVTWNENLTAGMYILRMNAENESREVRILINK